MPIRADYRWLYPLDWPQLSAVIRFEGARGRCETCGRPHGQIVRHLGDGRWWDEASQSWRGARGRRLPGLCNRDQTDALTTKVVLATAHLDHDPTNNRPRNLKALCQRCHLLHDRVEHQRRRWQTLQMRKALGDLFSGSYRR